MLRFAFVLGAAIALGLGSPGFAQMKAVADFKVLCMDTHAEAAAAFAAADKSGWSAAPGYAQGFQSLSGNPEGRVIDERGPDFRELTAGVATTNGSVVRRCFIVSPTPFESVIPELQTLFSSPTDKSDKVWGWNLMQSGGVIQQVDRDAYLKGHGPVRLFQVFAYQLGTGSMLEFDEMGGSAPKAP